MAFVLSSLSGNLISAASAGFAPTNSADVSAIASAYQVVSATATQLNAGTAYLTSVNDTPISAARAGNAANASLANSAWYDGTGRLISSLPDEATVSGIASAYAESAASSKQDASAMSSYALSSDVSGVIDTVSSNSASWAGGITGDYLTAKVGSGQATLSTALQDGMDKRPALVISAQRSAGSSMYPRMMVTDWNDTTGDTHSGALLANAFEFYICPNSARGEVDPSGLVQSRLDASHLQFNVNEAVSSYKRSSEFTRSGMKLGLSGNSASWVSISGNGSSGGFITLDDGSGTSGRIVASSIPYWNDKLDGSASSSFYSTANESGYVDSAYVESQISGKQDTLTFDWDSNSAISSINGSALAGQGGGASITAVSYDTSTHQSSIVTATGFGIVGSATNYPRISSVHLTDGQTRHLEANTLAPGAAQTASGKIPYTLLFSPAISMWTTADAATGIYSPLQYGTGAGLFMDSDKFKGYLKGNELFVCNTGIGQAARVEVHQSRGAHLCLTADKYGIVSGNFSPSEVVLSNGASHFTANLYANNNRGAALRLFGGTGSASNSQTSMAWLTPASLQVSNIASGTAKYAINSIALYDTDTSAQKTISSTSIDYWNAKMDSAEMSAYVEKSAYDELYSAFTALSGVISTYSAYFSSISAKVDNSAIGVIE